MISFDLRNKWHHCAAYIRLVECISIATVIALTICVPPTHAQVPERAFERRQDAILEKQSERPAPPRTVKEPPKAPKAVPQVTKTDLRQINQNMEALKQTLDQLNQTLKNLADALERQSNSQQQKTR